jgi:RNA polymerase sigma-70 factor (ECF subfamily)
MLGSEPIRGAARISGRGGLLPDSHDQLMQALHDEHAAALWNYCVRLTGHDRARAQDVCQEALLRAWKHPQVLSRPPAAMRSWLFTVARNIVIDEWRSRRAHAETITPEPPEPPEPAAGSLGEEEVDQLLQSWTVSEALGRLSAEHRAVLLECYYQGRTVSEAAHRLGVPQGTVKSRTHYALRALRLALEEMGVTG